MPFCANFSLPSKHLVDEVRMIQRFLSVLMLRSPYTGQTVLHAQGDAT